MTHTLIRGARLLEGQAEVLIRGDTIAEIAKPGIAFPPDSKVIDARGKLLHPGLANAHMHGHGNLAKGMGDRWTLELLLTAAPWTTGNRSLEDKYLGTLIGAAEMVMKGCTACYDLTVEFPTPSVEGLDAVGRAYRDVGMRAVVAPMVADLSFFEAIPGLMEALPPVLQKEVERLRLAPYRTTLENMRKALHGWKFERDEIRPAVAPTIPLHCSDDFMLGCANLAREYGTGLHTHVSESKVQAIAGLGKYGKSLAAHMDALGLIGPNFTVAHGVWLDDEDMKRLGARGASVAHNPGSNMRLGSGIADMRRMLECGINVGIGTDGANCSDNLNMYEAMRIASLASKVRGPDWQRWITTKEVLEAATAGGARALGFGDQIGRLAPGYKADIVFLDLDNINWIPLNDPVNALVHTEDGSAVHSVMIGGRMVLENRKLVNVDLARLARDAERARERLERLNRDNKTLYERLEPIVGSFCPALARQPLHINRYAT
jgi:5-methylthioadenosine/S-adenosylhomocysteine deaminase